MVLRDQRTELAASHLKTVLLAVEVGSNAVDVRTELVDIVNARLGGQLCACLILQIRQFLGVLFLDLLGLEARLSEFAFRQFHFVSHNAELALKLRVGVFSLCKPLIQDVLVLLKLFVLAGEILLEFF